MADQRTHTDILTQCNTAMNVDRRVEARQYRRGIDTIHDMIHNELYVAGRLIEDNAGPEEVEACYRNIIEFAVHGIMFLGGDMPDQDVQRASVAATDQAMQQATQIITEQPEETAPTSPPEPSVKNNNPKFGEKVPQQNEFTNSVDDKMGEVDKLLGGKSPVISKNARRR